MMILVSCGNRKLDHPAPAKDLYVGSYFKSARRAAESTGQPWLIVSAKYGIIDPETVIAPYDATIKTRADQRALARLVSTQRPPAAAESWLGINYDEALAWVGWQLTNPLIGYRMGQRMGWFTQKAAA